MDKELNEKLKAVETALFNLAYAYQELADAYMNDAYRDRFSIARAVAKENAALRDARFIAANIER